MPSEHNLVQLEHTGTCDASAAVPVGPSMFVVANDEDDRLRVYHSDMPGPPVQEFDLAPLLSAGTTGKEADIEGGTWLDDRVYWITSHARDKNGDEETRRRQFFAVEFVLRQDDLELRTVGSPYRRLLEDMLAEPALKRFGLEAASKLPPKQQGALNIEGLCATPDGALYIGFRNPVPEGKALVVPLLNPAELADGGGPARFGTAFELDLGGLGIRSIKYWARRRTYLIVAGHFDESPPRPALRPLQLVGRRGRGPGQGRGR